jgi:formylglycine-generating enzyme required for sulfatase activity
VVRGSRHLHAEDGSPREDGAELFRAVFKGEVKERWLHSRAKIEAGGGLLLRLRLEGAPELVGLPWECLYDPDQKEFLALQVETPVVRYLEVATDPVPEKAPIPLKVLVLSANPQGTESLQVKREVQAIQRALSPLGPRVRIVRLAGPSLTELESRLAECHVLHFSGHGTFNDESGTGALILEGRDGQPRTVDVHDLAGLLPRRHSLRLAVLNSCQGARHSDTDVFSGVAQALVQKGVPAVVAMRHDIEDDAAILFAERLYQAMAGGGSVPEAVTLGRKAIFAEHGDAWATPALYLRQDVKVFPRRRPVWPVIAALITGLVILVALARVWVPRLIADWECPSQPGFDMRFVEIPGGSFLMGSEPRGSLEWPPHLVTLSTFCFGAYEVTQEQWEAVMHNSPSTVKGVDLPVETVSWLDVRTFLRKLNEKDPAGRYRLATEAQWEYAASGSGRGIYGYGNDDRKLREYGNCDQGDRPSRVGSFQPTRWGLYDMHGNVAEWVADLEQYTAAPVVDPVGPPRSDDLGVRGGSFQDEPYGCRAAHRELLPPDARKPWLGFRVVRDPVH